MRTRREAFRAAKPCQAGADNRRQIPVHTTISHKTRSPNLTTVLTPAHTTRDDLPQLDDKGECWKIQPRQTPVNSYGQTAENWWFSRHNRSTLTTRLTTKRLDSFGR